MKTSDLIQLVLVGAFVVVLMLLFFQPVPAANQDNMKQALAALFGFIGGTGTGLLIAGKMKGDKDENLDTPPGV